VIKGQYGTKDGRYSVKVGTIQHPAEFLKSPLESARLGPSMMRSAEKGELYEQLPQAVQSDSENLASMGSRDTISTIADGLVPDR
jgi:flagellar motor switch protein FliM